MAVTTYTLPLASTWKFTDNIIGVADVSAVYTAGNVGAPGITPLPSVVIEQQLGAIVKATSYDTTYGGEAWLIFLAVPTSTTVTQGLTYKWKGDYTIEVVPSAVTTSQSSGQPVAVALNSVSSNTTSVQYTWFLCKGRCAVLKSATITAQPNVSLFVSNVTAGRVRTTSSAFRAFIGMRSANTATATGSILPAYLNFPNITSGS
jgi:hypothetical protein